MCLVVAGSDDGGGGGMEATASIKLYFGKNSH